MAKGQPLKFWTNEELSELRSIKQLPKEQKKQQLLLFCNKYGRTILAANLRMYNLGAKTEKVTRSYTKGATPPHGPIQVSTSRISIPIKGIEIASGNDGLVLNLKY